MKWLFFIVLCSIFIACNNVPEGIFVRIGDNLKSTNKGLLSGLGAFYPAIKLEKNRIATIYSMFNMATPYTLNEDAISIKTDTYDLIFQLKNEDALLGRGIANGVYVKVTTEDELENTLRKLKKKNKENKREFFFLKLSFYICKFIYNLFVKSLKGFMNLIILFVLFFFKK